MREVTKVAVLKLLSKGYLSTKGPGVLTQASKSKV